MLISQDEKQTGLRRIDTKYAAAPAESLIAAAVKDFLDAYLSESRGTHDTRLDSNVERSVSETVD